MNELPSAWRVQRLGMLSCILLIAFLLFGLFWSASTSAAEPARLYVAHLAPFGADEASSVTVRLSNEISPTANITLSNVVYGDSTGYVDVAAGTYLVEILPTGSDTVAISSTVTLSESLDYSAFAIGDISNQPLEILPLLDDSTAAPTTTFKLRLGHLAPFAATLANTTADVRLDDGTVIIDDVQFGTVSDYFTLAAGEYDLQITSSDGSTVLIDPEPVTFAAGDNVTAVATGNGAEAETGIFAIVNGAAGSFLPLEPGPRLFVTHLAPFGPDQTTTSVTVAVNSAAALENLSYGDSAGYIDLSEGEKLIEIIPTGASSAAISATVTLTEGLEFSAVAIGDGGNQPLDLILLEDDNSTPAAGNFKLRLGHLAPFAAELAGTRADVRLDSGLVILDDVEFGTVGDYIELPAGDYDLEITSPDGSVVLIDPAPLTFAEGDIVSAFAAGDGVNQPLAVYATVNGAPAASLPLEDGPKLYVGHLAPFAAEENTGVTVRLNGVDTLSDVAYGDSTGYLDLPEGEYLVEILPSGSSSVAISATVSLSETLSYTALAIGDGGNQPLSLLPLLDDNSAPASGNFRLRLGHLAPFADSLDATLADVRLQDGSPVLEGVRFGDVAAGVELPAGTYDLKITTPGGDTTLIDPAPVTFSDGDVVSAFATGDGSNLPFQVFAIVNGEVGGFLPEPALVQIAHLAPFADAVSQTGVTVSVNGSPLLSDFRFGDATERLPLAPGTYNIEIFPTGSITAAITSTVTVQAGVQYSLVAGGDGVNQPLDLLVLNDSDAGLSAPAGSQLLARFVHLAPFAAALEDTRVDIRDIDGNPIVTDVAFGEASQYILLNPDQYELQVTTPGGATVLLSLRPVSLEAGSRVTIFVTGDGVNQDLQGEVVFDDGRTETVFSQDTARLIVGHLAPFAPAASTSVTVTLSGTSGDPIVLTDVSYGDSLPYTIVPSDTYTVAVTPAGAAEAAITESVTLEAGSDYTAIAVGDGVNQPLSLVAAADDNAAPASGSGKIRFGHLAPFADTLDGTLADIRLQDGTALLSNVPFGTIAATYLELPAGSYDLKITTPGGGTTLIDPMPVTLGNGDVWQVFATGGINADLGIFAILDGESEGGTFLDLGAALYVAHLAPFASGDAAVVVAIDGEDALPNFTYGEGTGYIPLKAGDRQITITPVGASSPAISVTATFTQGLDYSAFAIGDGSNQDLMLLAVGDDNSPPASGSAKLRLGHLAPFADTLAATAADIRLEDGTVLVPAVEFGNLTETYLELAAGTYDLKITTPDGLTTLIDVPPVTLNDGDIVTALATGEGQSQPLQTYLIVNGNAGIFLLNGSGSVELYLPIIRTE